MALTDDDIQGIADLSRFAARASSREAIVRETFKTMKGLARIESLRVVYPYDHSGWEDWRVSGKGISMKRVDEWRDPASNSATANFDPDTPESGYISANPKSAKAGLLMPVLAPAVHTSMLLQSALARVQKANRSEAEMVQATLRARDEERRRISRELHDDLGQSMASLKLNLKWAQDILDKQEGMENVVEELTASREIVSVMLGKIRDLSHTLYPRILDTLGLYAALKELTLQLGRNSKVAIECILEGKEQPLEMEAAVALYRCCQESISNALRHADPSRLIIGVRYAEKEVCVTVEDNGRGFDPRSFYDSSGKLMSSGFWTIRQRMADLGGAFRVGTAEGQGTVIETIVPISNKKKNAKRKNKTTHR